MAKAKRDDVSLWKNRLEKAISGKGEVEAQWDISLGQYANTLQNTGEILKDKKIRVNLAFPTIKVMLRAACSSYPYIYVSGVNPQDNDGADILQYLENRLWRIQKRKKVLRSIVLDTLLMKVGYGLSHLRRDPVTGRIDVYLTRVSPRLLWLEKGATTVDDAYFLFRGILLSRQEAKAKFPDVAFPEYDLKANRTAMKIANAPDSGAYKGTGDRMDRVIIYEVHDQLNHEISYICPYSNKFLVEPKPNPYPFTTNFTQLCFNEIVDEHYGLGDLEPVSVQQEELDRVRGQMLIHTKRGNRKYAIQEDEYKEDRLSKLESGEDGAIIPMQDPDNIKPIQDANISTDIYNYGELLRSDHREITGINEYMNAGRIAGTKTAYETEQIMAGGRMRIGEKPDLVGDFCEDVTYKDVEMMKKLYPVPQLVQFLGPQAQVVWRYVQQWELQGEHYIEVHAGSTQPKDEVSNFQRGMLLYQTFANDPQVDHQALLQEVMTLMNIKNRNQLLGIPPVGGMMPGGGQSMQAMPYGMNPQSRSIPDYNQLRSALPGGGE